MIGEKFGSLTVLSQQKSKFICECEKCGQRCLMKRFAIYWGVCLCEMSKQQKKKILIDDKNREEVIKLDKKKRNKKSPKTLIYLKKVKSSAESRKIEFNIKPLYCYKLFKEQNGKCKISGIPIAIGENASLDRIDSSKGYIEGNIQWVLREINIMKWTLTMDEFHKMIETIYLYKYQSQPN